MRADRLRGSAACGGAPLPGECSRSPLLPPPAPGSPLKAGPPRPPPPPGRSSLYSILIWTLHEDRSHAQSSNSAVIRLCSCSKVSSTLHQNRT